MPEARIARNAIAASATLVVLAGGLAACGDSSSSGSSASKADFCHSFEVLGSQTTPGHAADELSKVGTPSDIGSSARHGFDLLVSHLRALPDRRSPGGITKMVQDMSDRDAADVRDFITYYGSECRALSGDSSS
jgi:hypothetical protein